MTHGHEELFEKFWDFQESISNALLEKYIRDLGALMDSRLAFPFHIDHIIGKSDRTLDLMNLGNVKFTSSSSY